MTAIELRLGNYVQSRINGVSVIEQIGSPLNPEYVAGRSLDGNYWENSFLPVEITEQWLSKFGFVKIPDFDVYTNIWELKGFMVSLGDYINIHVDWAEEIGHGYHSIRCYEVLFVHQLQNLYFALTGEELTIKN